MTWQLDPPLQAKNELDRMGQIELRTLMAQVRKWIEEGEQDDLALARAIEDKGHSEDFSYWLLKEVRMRESESGRS